MPRLLAALVTLAALSGCDPFVYEVDVPRFCAIVPGIQFSADGTSAHGTLPLELGLQSRLSEPGQFGEVELLSVSLAGSSVLGEVTEATLTIEPAPHAGPTVGQVQVVARAPSQPGRSTLSIPGQGADLFGPIRNGPAKLGITLTGPAAEPFTAEVTACVHVRLAKRYLQR